MKNLDNLFKGITFQLNKASVLGFSYTGATPAQEALIQTYRISILSDLENHRNLAVYRHKCPYCGATPYLDGTTHYGKQTIYGRIYTRGTIVCPDPACNPKHRLSHQAQNTFYNFYAPRGKFRRPTVVDYNK